MTTYLAAEMNGAQFLAGNWEVALLTLGSTENHGTHLPFAQDTFVAYNIALDVAAKTERILVLPPVYFGMSEHYQHAPFSISLTPGTMIGLISDALRSVHRWGIKRIIIINGHDGNLGPIEVAARQFKVDHPDVTIAACEKWWELPGQLLPEGTFAVWDGMGHAGEGETSIALHYFPELVQLDGAQGVVPVEPPYLSVKWLFHELTTVGTTGDPTQGTAEKGQQMAECVVNAICEFISVMREQDWRPCR